MGDFNNKIRKVICFFIAVFILALVVTVICLLMLKYEVEGEANMPFELSQMVIVSTAEGIDKEGESTWNFDVVQNNDIYIYISKNKNYKETEIIKSVTLNNFTINKTPEVGEIIIYRPTENEDTTYEYNEEYIIEEELKYEGSEDSSLKSLEIGNQGGVIALRYCNANLRGIFI